MKLTNENAFKKHLQDVSLDHIPPVYIILSKDDSEKSILVNEIVKALKSKAEISVKRFDDGAKDRLLDELQAYGLFSEKSILVVNDVEKLNKSHTTSLTDYFLKPNPLLYLVLSASTVNRATKFYKNIEKTGVVVDLTQLKPWEKEKNLVDKVLAIFKSAGFNMSPLVAQQLIKQIGTDQTLIENESQKLMTYLDERREVTKADVETICTGTNHETIWHFGDALMTGNLTEALSTGKAFLSDGTHLMSLLRQMRSQIQSKFQICSLLSTGGTAAQVTEVFPYMRGNILQRNMDIARGYGMKRFSQAILDIDKAEFAAKNSVSDPEFLLETLIVKLTK